MRALLGKAFARGANQRVQDGRKKLDLDVEETISLRLAGAERLSEFVELVKAECRLEELSIGDVSEAEKEWEIEGETVTAVKT